MLLFAAALALGACSAAPDLRAPAFDEGEQAALPYEIELAGVSDPKARALMEESLALYRRQDRGALSLAFLRRRAQGDVETALKILASLGWRAAEVDVAVIAPDAEGGAATARLTVTENARYRLAAHELTLTDVPPGDAPPALDAAALGSPVGEFAEARPILDAETAAVGALRAGGRIYAAFTGRDAVADPAAAEIRVESVISTGRAYRFGETAYEGAETVRRDHLDTYRTWRPGDAFDPAKLKEFQNELVATGLFNVVAAQPPETPPAGDEAPVTVRLEAAPARTVTAGLRYDTDIGPAARGGFQHRNLFGGNETLTLQALAGLEEQSAAATYRAPQFRRPKQDLVLGLTVEHVDDDAFEEIGGTIAAGLERRLTPALTVGAGGLAELNRTRTDGVRETARLVGLPVFAAYDTSDDLLDPSTGARARIAVTPIAGFQADTPVTFAIADATASAYFDLTGSKEIVLAARGRVASIISGDLDVVSPARRLYAGGGGSVRGYAERFIGPLDDDGDPTGGLSAVEAGLELRARVSSTIGLAAFVEAGSVSTDIAPTFDEGVQAAVGGGLRYFSPVGPFRIDLGFPVNRRKEDDLFQLYISIGQAF